MSPLFFRPTHVWRPLKVGTSPAVRAGWAAHVPIVTHGFPPEKCTLAESLYLAVAAVGAMSSRKSEMLPTRRVRPLTSSSPHTRRTARRMPQAPQELARVE